MPEWATFVGFTVVVTSGLLVLSHASRGALVEPDNEVESGSDPIAGRDVDRTGHDRIDTGGDASGRRPVPGEPHDPDRDGAGRGPGDANAAGETGPESTTLGADRGVLPKSGVAYRRQSTAAEAPSAADLSTPSLLANVALSQGLFGALLAFGAWYAEIPARAFGIGSGITGFRAAVIGAGLGVALYAANEASAALGARFGLGVGDGRRLRAALAPDTLRGWVLLLVVVLPVIAGFEEVLFRGAIVGVVSAGYGVSPWVMAVVGSGAFALGHGAQGRLGVVVTGVLGFVLAAAFVVTGSLVVVVVAHYLVNALEFVVHEGIGVEWPPDGA